MMDEIIIVVEQQLEPGRYQLIPAPEGTPAEPTVPWDLDLADEVPRRAVGRWKEPRWPKRKLSDLTHITVHHIGSIVTDMQSFLRAYLYKGVGRPAPPYSLWIERDGTVKKLLHLDEANWHDHSGSGNGHHWSIGLQGALHHYKPTKGQLDALVRACVWAINNPEMNIARDRITGHMDWTSTECPGWTVRGRDHWKAEFFERLDKELAH